MKSHDYAGLNDAQCVYVDHFADRLRHWRENGIADATCWRVARREASESIALDKRVQVGADEYLSTRFEIRKSVMRPEGLPVSMLVVKWNDGDSLADEGEEGAAEVHHTTAWSNVLAI